LVENIYEILRRYEFNKTEPETLTQLVKSAIEKGTDTRSSIANLSRKAIKVMNILKREDFIKQSTISEDEKNKFNHLYANGIDGSVQVVGGLGGIWHAPTSCAIITFEEGILSRPKITVEAHIEDIFERDPIKVQSESIRRMMWAESKAIKRCAQTIPRDRRTVVFLDGPIIDPPFCTEEKFVDFRCEALKECLDKGVTTIGIVKRVIGRLFIDHIIFYLLKNEEEKKLIDDMFSDMNLSCHIFTRMASDCKRSVIHTEPINMVQAKENEVAIIYQKHGVEVVTLLMQKDFCSRPIRVDIAIKKGSDVDLRTIAMEAIKMIYFWSPPGSILPIPIMLAHDKSNIRKGCAEVLYSEIMTRLASSDTTDNMIKAKLFKEV
jgi:hypothetical protein